MKRMNRPITWKNDSLLLDKKQGLTLNALLENCEDGTKKEQLLKRPLENFYGILIRKTDFIRKKSTTTDKRIRILTRMPYVPLNHYPFLKETIKEKDWLLAEASRDYFYQSAQNDLSIKSWKKRIERYLKSNTLPLPLLRVDEEPWRELITRVFHEKKIIIQSAKREESTIPLILSEKLVYLLGVIDGDGHLTKHQVHIVDYSKKHIEQLQRFFEELFGVTGDIRAGREKNYYILLVNGKWIVRLINFLTGHPLGRKYDALQEPLILREKPFEKFRGAYWRGMFDADASFKKEVTFTSISKQLSIDLHHFLETFKIDYYFKEIKIEKGDNAYLTTIPSGSRKKLFDQIDCWYEDKKQQFLRLINKEQSRLITFQGVNKKSLTSSGFFDFSLLPRNITIANLGGIIRQSRERAGLSRKVLAQKMGISYANLTAYELHRANPSLDFLLKYLDFRGEPLMTFLENMALNYFQLKNTKVRLCLKPTEELLALINSLYPLSNYYIGIKGANSKIIKEIEDFFDMTIKTNTNRFSNSVLHHFLTTFFIFE
ncbi:MAG: helix-turn-helix domain-containing protein [Candidatus Heimdallarchaeota archaeon]|nr:helix-turn-helix domain-containing protein [Candidatus Heimdallarchaeota archaeon]